MDSNNVSMYSRSAFSLSDDGYVLRCAQRSNDGILASLDDLPKRGMEICPFDERYTSPMAYRFRSPNLPDAWWKMGENKHEAQEYIGIRILLFSTINSIHLKTMYFIESTGHPIKKWKRIIVTFHINECCPFYPHVICEMIPEYLKKLNKISTIV
jgi:hypothetical protein